VLLWSYTSRRSRPFANCAQCLLRAATEREWSKPVSNLWAARYCLARQPGTRKDPILVDE